MNLWRMRSYIISTFIFLIFAPSSIYGAGLTNGSFESGNDGSWTNAYSTSVMFTIDHTDPYEASTSAKITYDGASSRGIEQTISSITGGQQYHVSGAIKLDAANIPDSAYIRIAWYASTDASGTQLSTAPTNNNDGIVITTDWSPVDFIVQAPSTAQSAEIRLYVQGGAAYFDAILFDKSVAPSQTPTAPPPTPTTTKSPTPMPSVPSAMPTSMPTSMPTMTPMPTIGKISYNNVYISEVMVAPSSGENEWVELYNGNDFSVTLTNWYIDDIADGGSSPRIFTLSIPAKGYEIIDLSSGIYNNSGDSVRLLDSDLALKHEFSYASSEKDYTWGAQNKSFNSFCIQSPSKKTSNSGCVTVSDDAGAPTLAAAVVSPPPARRLNTNTGNSSSGSSSSQSHKYYRIVVVPPVMPTHTSPQILGVRSVDSSKQSTNDEGQLPFLAGTYSLLSGISLGLKVYLKQG